MGEMERLFREFDWSATTIGRPECWPVAWRNAVRIVLDSSFPSAVGLGPDLLYFCNDAFIPLGGPARHPAALGQPARLAWREIWPDVLSQRLAYTLRTGLPTGEADLMVPLLRSGFLEETYLSFSFAALRDDQGRPNGIFCTAVDNTGRVIAQRQIECLRGLAAGASFAASPQAACRAASEVLEQQPRDVPFALLYVLDRTGRRARLAASCGLREIPDSLLRVVEAAAHADPLSLAAVIAGGAPELIDRVDSGVGMALRRSDLVPRQALAVPVVGVGRDGLSGLLVSGLNPMRPTEESRAFLMLVAQQLGAAISGARARQHAQRRARKLVALNRAKTEFFGNVSHELRTPLASLRTWLELLRSGRIPAAQAPLAIEALDTASQSLSGLVQDLLDYSAAVSGELRVEARPVTSLTPVILPVVQAFQPVAQVKDLVLSCESRGSAGPLRVDALRLQQVVWNLVTNAIRHTPPGGRIEVGIVARDTEVEIGVRDTGVGIRAEELPRIFGRYWRGQSAREASGGLGLGLPITRRIVELHGGSISAHSDGEGRGAAFVVRLPMSKDGAMADTAEGYRPEDAPRLQYAVSAAAHSAARQVRERGADVFEILESAPRAAARALRILLVEDDDGLARGCQRLLSSHGHWVIRVKGCAAGLRALAAERVDLIVSDVRLADGDVFELAAGVRKFLGHAAPERLPFVVMSASPGRMELARCRAAGFAALIGKPFQESALLRALREARRRGPLSQGLRR